MKSALFYELFLKIGIVFFELLLYDTPGYFSCESLGINKRYSVLACLVYFEVIVFRV